MRTRPTLVEVDDPGGLEHAEVLDDASGSAMSNGRASSLTDAGPRASRSTIARRLPSPSAWNIRSSAS